MNFEIHNTSMAVDLLAQAMPDAIESVIRRIEPNSKLRVRPVSKRSQLLNIILFKIARGEIAVVGEWPSAFEQNYLAAMDEMNAHHAERDVVAGFLKRRFSADALVSALVEQPKCGYVSWKSAFNSLLRNGSIYLDILQSADDCGALIRLSDCDRLRLRAQFISAAAFHFLRKHNFPKIGSRYQAAFYRLIPATHCRQEAASNWLRNHPSQLRPVSWWINHQPELSEYAAGATLIGRPSVLSQLAS